MFANLEFLGVFIDFKTDNKTKILLLMVVKIIKLLTLVFFLLAHTVVEWFGY